MAAAIFALGFSTTAGVAAESMPLQAPAVFLDTDPVAAKLLGAARDYLAARQWGDAVDLLRQIADQHGERLVMLEPGRYVNVRTVADIYLAGMPPEGLKLYRAKVDQQARRRFEAAQKIRDESALERLVQRGFLSSFGDDALMLLGEFAWERGDLVRARNFWQKLLPANHPATVGELPLVLTYPDSSVDVVSVEARLVLCSLMQGNLSRARIELETFRKSHPIFSGELAGRRGNFAEILTALVAEAQPGATSPAESAATTFAGNPARNQVFPQAIDVGTVAWSVLLKEMRVERPPRAEDFVERFERFERGSVGLPVNVLSYFPVVWKNVVFYCDDSEIYARDLMGQKPGRPAWGNDASIFRVPHEFEHPPLSRLRAGLPRFSLSIDEDRLFARLGNVATNSARNRGVRPPVSSLVCLDLGRQGDLAWIVKADDLEGDAGKWAFDGAPLAADGRVYAPLRRNDPQLQLNVACFDAATGKLIWNRKVCGGVETIGGDVEEIRHQLLTLADESLVYCTNLGAVAALDPRDGLIRWVTTYPRLEAETIAAFNKRQQQGPNPCVFHEGLVIAAPTDGDRILAYHSQTGVLEWELTLDGQATQLFGVSGSRLIAAGDRLWAIDVDRGRLLWSQGQGDPAAATWGRGILAGDLIYWPRREEILLVEIATGNVRRRVDLAGLYGLPGGGNITIAGGMLLVAQSDRLLAFSPLGGRKKTARDEVALRPAGKRN
jgi:outer membrane protein assembly factor BamB